MNSHYHRDEPPHLPPLSVSLPSPTRPEPKPKPKPRPIPKPEPTPSLPLQLHPNPNLNPSPSPSPLEQPEPTPQPPNNSSHLPLQLHSNPNPIPNPVEQHESFAVEKYYSPLTSPLPTTSPPPLPPPPHQVINFNRREEIPPTNSGVINGGVVDGERKARRVRFGGKKEDVAKKIGLLIRVLEIVLCLISFSVMASDKTQGWSGDSFDRYKEYRFCLTVAILGFVYSTFQTFVLGSYLATGKHVITHRLRYQFDFLMDQILAYLLISASSAAASRVDDWQTNWGKDEFTEKASGSISMAFLAFFCFAGSSLISGYNLCNRDLY